MKKILCLLMILALFTITSCAKKPSDIKPDFGFKTSNEIMESFDVFDVTLKINNEKYVISQAEEGLIFIKYITDDIFDYYTLYDAKTKNEYLVNDYNHIKELVKNNSNVNFDTLVILKSILTAHLSINNDFVKKSDNELFLNRPCSVYEYAIDGVDDTKEVYYVDNETGGCLSHVKEVKVGSEVQSTGCYFESFSLTASPKIKEALAYRDGNVNGIYNEWPDTELGQLIPDINNGEFVKGIDTGDSLTMNIRSISYKQMINYINSLKNTKFKNDLFVINQSDLVNYYNYFDDVLLTIKWVLNNEQGVQISIEKNQTERINELWNK